MKSSLKPGVGITAPAGIASGGVATGAAVGGAMAITGEYSESVNSLTDKTAKQITKQLTELFVKKGWLPLKEGTSQ